MCCNGAWCRALRRSVVGPRLQGGRIPAAGCCFVEESCEAMLSRLAAACVRQRQLTSFRDTLDLWFTLPPTSTDERSTRGRLRRELVDLFHARVRRLISSAATVPFADTARKLCVAGWPPGVRLPQRLPDVVSVDQAETALRGAMVCVTGAGRVAPAVAAFLSAKCVRTTRNDLAVMDNALEEVRAWRLARAREHRPRPRRPGASQASPVAEADASSQPVASQGATQSSVPDDADDVYEPPERNADSVSEGQSSGLEQRDACLPSCRNPHLSVTPSLHASPEYPHPFISIRILFRAWCSLSCDVVTN